MVTLQRGSLIQFCGKGKEKEMIDTVDSALLSAIGQLGVVTDMELFPH